MSGETAVKTRQDAAATASVQRKILLVGNTNVGKSTIFNAVTGAHQAIVNAPGTTVEVMAGTWRTLNARVLDLPGTYSLIPTSPDEAVVSDTLSGVAGSLTDAAKGAGADLVLAIVDATSLTRSLYLLGQLAQTGHAVAAVLTRVDVAEKDGVKIDPSQMSKVLGIPVLSFDPRKSKHYPVLDEFVKDALLMRPHIRGIAADPSAPGYSVQAAASAGKTSRSCVSECGCTNHVDQVRRADERNLLAQTLCSCGKQLAPGEDCARESSDSADFSGADESATTVVVNIGLTAEGAAAEAEAAAWDADADDSLQTREAICGCEGTPASSLQLDREYSAQSLAESEIQLAQAKKLFGWVERVEAQLEHQPAPSKSHSWSDRADRIFLNPVIGPIIFFAVMWFLFKLAGEWVGPVQDLFDGWFASTDEGAFSLANGILWLLGLGGLEETWLASLLVKGVATGLGVVASFVPLMFVIFVAISILEDSGYMARAAFLADRLMRKVGLDGRVVLPLIMGFGCNLPSLAAARALPSAKQRFVTAIITPYTSCAARLTIYLMIAKIFFPENTGTVVFAMYLVSVVMVVFAAWILKLFVTKDEAKSPLMLVLPSYQLPRVIVLLKLSLGRTWAFVIGAGKIIVLMTLVVWLLGAIPMGGKTGDAGFASEELAMEDSAYGQVAKVLEPVFTPAGFGEWHLTGALMTGFVAKETVVSSIVVSYNLDESAAGDAEENGDDLGVLPQLLTASFEQTAGAGYAGLGAIAFLIFVLTYTPCLATVGEQTRLLGGKVTAVVVVAQLFVAWLLAVGVFQIGRLIL